MSAKGPGFFQILICYFIDVRLKLLCVRFALNLRTNMKKMRTGNSNVHLRATSKKASVWWFKSPNSMKCLSKAD